MDKPIIYDDLDTNSDSNDYQEYYCANIVEKLFDCENRLLYKKSSGGYRYCSTCYDKWKQLKEKPIIKKTDAYLFSD